MITADAQQLEPGGRVTLFELDATPIGADQLRFHQHLQSGVIWWQGQQYGAWPVEASGFARTSDQQPAPRLRVSNIDGRIGVMCQLYGDLVGARLTRRQTLVKYLDAASFPGENRIRWSNNPGGINGGFRWNYEGSGTGISLAPQVIEGVTFYPVSYASAGASWHRVTTAGAVGFAAGDTVIVTAYLRLGTSSRARVSLNHATVGGVVYSIVTGTGSSVFSVNTSTAGVTTILSQDDVGGGVRKVVFKVVLNKDGISTTASIGPDSVVVGADVVAYGIQIENAVAPQGFFIATGAQPVVGGFNPTADPDEFFPDELWFIERKVVETKEVVEFELATAIDLNGEVLPGRQIMSNLCTWVLRGGYRGPYCGYSGAACFDINDNPTSDPSQDVCAGLVRSCQRRFGQDSELPYGGFPAAGLIRT
ncbi:phage minor tail protein L [Stenotrophomonas sp. 24(2023)]|uniref:phage minor tail protein L n=1 Tax=Stenotrophomonas sp. 24(2023) TaxID=3068324 RepID=UPI0027DFACAE|nr:phage minor tail protein L [Stenotrophomonas sp. 24(2023)]WMJ68730.1 phage minor tail protein L [Stenotrophomonas sp. 24(2023)]